MYCTALGKPLTTSVFDDIQRRSVFVHCQNLSQFVAAVGRCEVPVKVNMSMFAYPRIHIFRRSFAFDVVERVREIVNLDEVPVFI
jgi:hypothetical protein